MRLAVLGGPRELRGAEAEVKQPLALGVEEEEGLGVRLGQTHPMTRVDLEAAEAAHLRLEHHGRCYTGALARGSRVRVLTGFTHFSSVGPNRPIFRINPKKQMGACYSTYDVIDIESVWRYLINSDHSLMGKQCNTNTTFN